MSDALTTAKSYTDSSISTEVTNRNAAITAKADSITTEVSKTYTKQETFSAYKTDADGRIATANSNASTAVSTAQTAASDAATAKTQSSTAVSTADTAKSTADTAKSTADSASEQTVELSSRLDQTATDMTAVQAGVDANASDVADLNERLSNEVTQRQSFMRFSEESGDPTLTLGQTDSPAQVKLTNKQLQFLYLNTVVAYMSGDALLINNAKILQQLQLGGFAFVPGDNGNLAFKWVGGDS